MLRMSELMLHTDRLVRVNRFIDSDVPQWVIGQNDTVQLVPFVALYWVTFRVDVLGWRRTRIHGTRAPHAWAIGYLAREHVIDEDMPPLVEVNYNPHSDIPAFFTRDGDAVRGARFAYCDEQGLRACQLDLYSPDEVRKLRLR